MTWVSGWVRTTSMSVDVPHTGSRRVGVVMVVKRLFSVRNCVKGCWGVSLRRSMLMSPCIVMVVLGCFVVMVSRAVWRFLVKSGSWWGGLYMLMMVLVGFVFCLLAWMCRIMVVALGILISSRVVWRLSFQYADSRALWWCLYP